MKECIIKDNTIYDTKTNSFVKDGNGFNVLWLGDGKVRKCVNHKHFETKEKAFNFIDKNNFKLVDKLN